MAPQTDPGVVLVIDDETNIRRTLALVLEGDGLEVVGASSAEDGLALLARRRFDAVMLDVCLPGMDGLAALETIMADDAHLPVVMISGHASIRDAVRATRLGAFDFLEKPLSRERVLVTLRNCVRRAKDLGELQTLRAEREQRTSILLGNAPTMVELRRQIAKVAPTKGRVLITGESGTGKELIAREIHERSTRSGRPFIKVNCAAIPGDLIESSLFGHERGAFTSAVGRRRGHFEQADRGTLFLDEIGDMSLSAQAKVLRVLQTGELTRVGSEQPIRVDVRVLAATNRDLEAACKDGTFRDDLYFRLNVIPLTSPPLDHRKSDIPLMVSHFLAQVCAENGFRPKPIDDEVLVRLQARDWPGNVRELRNVVERLVILSDERITVSDLPGDLDRGHSGFTGDVAALYLGGTLKEFRDAAERQLVTTRLEDNGWNISRTADTLGLERTNLHKKMKSLAIARPSSNPTTPT